MQTENGNWKASIKINKVNHIKTFKTKEEAEEY